MAFPLLRFVGINHNKEVVRMNTITGQLTNPDTYIKDVKVGKGKPLHMEIPKTRATFRLGTKADWDVVRHMLA